MATTTAPARPLRLPPRWFIRTAWVSHRAWHRMTGGRRGLWLPTTGGKFGALRLRTVGRRSGEERAAILGYFEDGPDLVTLAMNGWATRDPAWWLNLQAHPDAAGGPRGRHLACRARTGGRGRRADAPAGAVPRLPGLGRPRRVHRAPVRATRPSWCSSLGPGRDSRRGGPRVRPFGACCVVG